MAAYAAPDIPYDKSERDKIAKKNFPESFMSTKLRHFQSIYILIRKKSSFVC